MIPRFQVFLIFIFEFLIWYHHALFGLLTNAGAKIK